MSIISRIWEDLIRNRYRSRLLLFLVTLPALIATSTLKLDPRWTNALPREDPLIDEFLQVVEDPLRGSTVYAVVDGPGARKAARKFADAVGSLPHVSFVHGVGSEVLPYELMFLSRDEIGALADFSDEMDVGELIMVGFDEPPGDAATTEAGVDTEEFESFLVETLEALAAALEGRPHASAHDLVAPLFNPLPGLPSENDSALLVRVETDFSENSIDDLSFFVEAMSELQREILLEPPHARIRLTGYPVTAYDEVRRIETSGKKLTLWALLIIMVVMKLFLRSLRIVFYSITVLLISLLWVLGLTRVIFGEMNTVTMIMGMVLIGLGIDYCIHWLNHHRQGMAEGLSGGALARHIFDSASPPIMAGAVSTAGAFLCILLMDVPSLQEFAMLSAGGVILTALVVLFVMPFMIPEGGTMSASQIRVREWTVSVAGMALGHPGRVVGLFLGLLLVSGWFLQNLAYEYNYSRLQIGGLPSYKLKQEIIQRFQLSSDILIQRVRGVENSAESKRKLLDFPEVARVESISDYLLPDEELEARARKVADLMNRLENTPALRYEMEDLAEIHQELLRRRRSFSTSDLSRAAKEEFDRYSRVLNRIINAVDLQTLDVLNDFNRDLRLAFQEQVSRRADVREIGFQDLPIQVKAGFETSEPGVYLQYIFPARNLWEKGPAEAMESVLEEAAPKAVSLSRISYRLMDIMLTQGLRMAVVAFLVVLTALRIVLKKWHLAIMAAVPLLLGGILTAGTMSLLGVRINFYNLVGIPILLGIGIDDGVHLINAYRRRGDPDPVVAVREVGAAVLLTSLTSMVGFGCLSFYQHPGMATLGVFLFVGVGWCMVATLLLLPVLLQWSASGGPQRGAWKSGGFKMKEKK